jgi:hypothetical protein
MKFIFPYFKSAGVVVVNSEVVGLAPGFIETCFARFLFSTRKFFSTLSHSNNFLFDWDRLLQVKWAFPVLLLLNGPHCSVSCGKVRPQSGTLTIGPELKSDATPAVGGWLWSFAPRQVSKLEYFLAILILTYKSEYKRKRGGQNLWATYFSRKRLRNKF